MNITKELEAKIAAAEALEDVVKICAEAGIEVTEEMLKAELEKQKNGELDEAALENVSGGLVGLVALGAAAAVVGIWAATRNNHGGGRGGRISK